MRRISIALLMLMQCALTFGDETKPVQVKLPPKPSCEDHVTAKATVAAKLDSPLFHETKTALNWWMVEHDGSVEDTSDGEITANDLVRIEKTAACTSTHQGKHQMEFCDAVREGENVQLNLIGGLPAYASGLSITIDPSLSFRCSFSATYPGPSSGLHWRITKKEMRLKSRDLTAGRPLFGWVSVTLEESDDSGAKPQSFKIEGYIKPVIQHKPAGAE